MRSQQFRDGYAHASREAMSYLHELADSMNDPHARQVLTSAAYGLGHHFARRCARMAAPPNEDDRPDPCA